MLLDGKKLLITGVVNRESIAYEVGRQAQEYLGYAQSYSLSELLATGRPPNLRRWLDDEKD
jgi:enoyl-[acyl-carrier-protein] reductase (NADH)